MVTVKEPTATNMATRTAVILVFFVAAFTAALAIVYTMTKPAIDASAAEEKMRTINEVLPSDLYDNDLLADTLTLQATPELGQDDESTVYRGRLKGEASTLVLEAIAPDGYAGKIRMLLAIRANGEVAGVRVTLHKETPGLGDYIEPKKDKNKTRPWITQFNGLSLNKMPTANEWKVKKDGGHFDSVAGATVTPRAVTKAVYKAVKFATENRERLFAPKSAKE
ncbi:MAG: electron transport complex subunit RsxG [Betaproteobacteria bacterium]|nr:electron transport complex subunit RsxG [Betaproteobacteria bacterium]